MEFLVDSEVREFISVETKKGKLKRHKNKLDTERQLALYDQLCSNVKHYKLTEEEMIKYGVKQA